MLEYLYTNNAKITNMILIGPNDKLITQNKRGYVSAKNLRPSWIFDGTSWLDYVTSAIGSYDLDIFKVTFSDGHSFLTSGDQKLVLNSGKVRSVARLRKGLSIKLGRFHQKGYYNPDFVNTDNHLTNVVTIDSVTFHQKGVLYLINGLGFNQNLCLSNGVILQN